MTVGIILPMREEFEALNKYFHQKDIKQFYNLTFYEGTISQINCVIVECGIGKVNAARTAQIMIDKMHVDKIINIGVAGGLSPDLQIGDIVAATKLVQHDFDITHFGHERGFITGIGQFIPTSSDLLSAVHQIADSQASIRLVDGVIASGDVFCTEPAMADKIHQEFGALCVEMEGAAIAQVCYLCNIPFIILRSISDTPNGNNEIDFEKFFVDSSSKVSKLLVDTLPNIKQ